ncbi:MULTISPECIES: siderophore-interacting protein [unclassified Rhizobium]|uniref:siderophore-interacting protein n=1 Tax=unclassified Rhizobium TaxID=2613769 RepID=UPI001ADAE935|nr:MULTISPECIES: siderophore-interacting protein [unclassified Rhizobium]MBO9127812.1 siderophore-interacting protein [Rhizobium sp. 16-488-2b]MBO9178274.1 siderophore-interacting protein [Rhizobium sp. 16-488-2a]
MVEESDFHAATVLSRKQISPSMIRVVLGGGELRGFASCRGLDEFAWFSFPAGDASLAAAPGRYYTIRHWDEAEGRMTVDFVSHQGGIGSTWARLAEPGDRLGVLKSRFRYVSPADACWIVLLADATGLPAVGRIIEERPSTIPVVAHVEISTIEDRQDFSAHGYQAYWHESFNHFGRPSRLSEIAAELKLPQGPGYVWIAGEASEVAACRRYFRDTLGLPRERLTSIGYWIHGQARS